MVLNPRRRLRVTTIAHYYIEYIRQNHKVVLFFNVYIQHES
jgi:hypothetical protein